MDVEMACMQDSFLTKDVLQEMVRPPPRRWGLGGPWLLDEVWPGAPITVQPPQSWGGLSMTPSCAVLFLLWF